MKPVLAIVGRPNVGKSTLFNRLSHSRDAIVEEIGSCFHNVLYRPGTVTIEIEAIIAEGDYVDCRFILDAMTVRANLGTARDCHRSQSPRPRLALQ